MATRFFGDEKTVRFNSNSAVAPTSTLEVAGDISASGDIFLESGNSIKQTNSNGVIGGIFVAIGLVLTWKLNQIRIVITTITLAGLLGGLILLIDWVALVFWVWQPILLLGIGIAVQIDSAKSSAEQ